MKIFDFHTHYFPDKIAADTIRSIENKCGIKAALDGTKGGLLRSMHDAGIDFSLNLPVVTSPEKVGKVNEICALNNHAPIFSAGAMHPFAPDAEKLLERVAQLGLKGVKMHPEYQSFDPLSPECLAVCAKCEELGLFILFHAGEDIAFEAPFNAEPAKFAEIIGRFPSLRLILAHMGGWRMWDEIGDILGSSIYIDCSLTADFLEAGKIAEIIGEHGADKVIFGSDSPWQSQKVSVDLIMNLPLTDTEREKIFCKNAAAILGLDLDRICYSFSS